MSFTSSHQMTLKHAVKCTGVALHSGAKVTMTLHPAEENHGIVFVRTDRPIAEAMVSAQAEIVSDTMLGTTLTNAYGTKVMTVEHLMAALWGSGIDNCLIELDGPEVPIMDGSSEPFVFLIECAGLRQQDALRSIIKVQRTIAVEDNGSTAVLSPSDDFSLDITIHFAHDAIGTQQAHYDFSEARFKYALSRARTFGFAKDVDMLRKNGLAQGGSLHNAIVLDESGIVNKEGLRYADEFVRHKALDCVGDYFLAGHYIHGAVSTFRPGHGINNKLIRALPADSDNYQMVQGTEALPAMPVHLATDIAVGISAH